MVGYFFNKYNKYITRFLLVIFSLLCLKVSYYYYLEYLVSRNEKIEKLRSYNLGFDHRNIQIKNLKSRFTGYPRPKDIKIKYFIVHGTAGGDTVNWIKNLEEKYWTAKTRDLKQGVGLFHYIIDRKGIIWNIVDPLDWVWNSSGGAIFDQQSVSVELENNKENNAGFYTEQQYISLIKIFAYLDRIKNFDFELVYGHRRVMINSRVRNKQCPGIHFDWDRFNNDLNSYLIKTEMYNETILLDNKNSYFMLH